MKAILHFGFLVLFLFSCNNENEDNCVINTKHTNSIKGDVLFSKSSTSYYFDIEMTKDYIVLLDSESDSVIQVYDKYTYKNETSMLTKKIENKILIKPTFVKSIQNKNRKESIIQVVDNNMYFKTITIKKQEIEIQTSLLARDLTPCIDYAVIGKELYGSPRNSYKNHLFYYFNADSGYYWVDPPCSLIKEASETPHILISNLYANESKSIIVTALRYSNYICFFDLCGNLQKTIKFGDENITPKIRPIDKELDAPNSIKCFINMYGTENYLYCLYTGSNDFSAKSKILVFNWNKKHIATLQTDRSLRCITVDENDQYILGISSNESDGQDIIQYPLNTIF